MDINAEHKPDAVGDVSDLSWLPSGHFAHVLASDILEHIPRPKIQSTLASWNQAMMLGGVLELRVPNVIGLTHLLESSSSLAKHEELLKCLFGTQGYTGDFHYFGFTRLVLSSYLEIAGFTVHALQERDGWLFEAWAIKTMDKRPDPLLQGDDETFLRLAYAQYFRRDPDPAGQSYYLERLKNGISREAILEAFQDSAEHQNLLKSPDAHSA